MTGVGDDSGNRSSGRPWFAVGLILALGATFALVLADDLRWLRLGILAALWAALVGAFVAVKYRKQAVSTEEAAARAQEIYELELEREIAARREFELEVETETRQRVEKESQDELDALRAEVVALRESLQALFGGEVLWERVALTAQSTRMRSLAEEPHLITSREAGDSTPAEIAAPDAIEFADLPTQLISRLRDLDSDVAAAPPTPPPARQVDAGPRAGAPRTRFVPRPSRPVEDSRPSQRPVPPPTRPANAPERAGSAIARAREGAGRARAELSRPRQRPVANPTTTPAANPTGDPAAGPGDTMENPVERSRPAVRPVPAGVETPTRSLHVPRREPVDQAGPDPTELTRPAMIGISRGRPPSRVVPPVDTAPLDDEPTSFTRNVPDAPGGSPDAQTGRVARALSDPEPQANEASPNNLEPTRPAPNPTLPAEIRDLVGKPGGRRRRRAEPDNDDPDLATTASGGRRRRRDEDTGPRPADAVAGAERHGKSDTGSATTGRRRAAEPADEEAVESSGSHSEGRSVSELLAAYGGGSTTPRRRRRARD